MKQINVQRSFQALSNGIIYQVTTNVHGGIVLEARAQVDQKHYGSVTLGVDDVAIVALLLERASEAIAYDREDMGYEQDA